MEVRWELFDSWSRELAWWLGLLYGDGYSKAGETDGCVHLVCDPSTVLKWATLVARDHGHLRIPKSSSKVAEIYLHSKPLALLLERRWGFRSPKRELTWPVDLPGALVADFLRGLWDSDGSLTQDWSKGYGYPVCSYSSTSDGFTARVKHEVALLSGVDGNATVESRNPTSTSFVAKWSGAVANQVSRALYREAPRLLRNDARYAAALESWLWEADRAVLQCACGQPARREGQCNRCWHAARPSKARQRCPTCEIRFVHAHGQCAACGSQALRGAPQRKRKWGVADLEGLQSLDITDENKGRLVDRVVALYTSKSGTLPVAYSAPDAAVLDAVRSAEVRVSDGVVSSFSRAGREACLWAHPHIHRAFHKGFPSVAEAWADAGWLRKAVEAQVTWGDPVTPTRVFRALQKLVHAPGNLSPALARWVVDRYGTPGGTVVDPCAGFGGRLLGAVASPLGVTYVGMDIVRDTIRGNERLASRIGAQDQVQLNTVDSTQRPWPAADLVFTCPPYYDLEGYGGAPIVESYTQWHERLMVPLLRRAKVAPYLVLVLGDYRMGGHRYPLVEDTRRRAEQDGWVLHERFVIARQSGVAREHLLVFAKPPLELVDKT